MPRRGWGVNGTRAAAAVVALLSLLSCGEDRPPHLDTSATPPEAGRACVEGNCSACGSCVDACVCRGEAQGVCESACDEGSAGAGGASCAYPTKGYGVGEANAVDVALSWSGYRAGSDEASTLRITDYFDCDHAKGVRALLITEGAVWCEACRVEAKELDTLLETRWKGLGISVLALVAEDRDAERAKLATADAWRRSYGGRHFDIAADPGFSFMRYGHVELPIQLVVDPRTMKIVSRREGYTPGYPELEALAAANDE